MTYTLVGLGNPGEEYVTTRHNVGRMMVEFIAKKNDFSEFKKIGKLNALESVGKIGKEKVRIIEPETMMNKSGVSIAAAVKTKKDIERTIVIYDDIDLPLEKIKISFNRSSGGHRGVESIIRSLKTESFIRIRIGIAPTTPSGKIKKPQGEDKVIDFIIGNFKDKELLEIKKLSKKVYEAVETIITGSKEKAMSEFNQ